MQGNRSSPPLSVPAAGRTIQKALAPVAYPLLDSFEGLKQGTPLAVRQQVARSYQVLYARTRVVSSQIEYSEADFELACAAAISIVLVARLAKKDSTISLDQAELWFLGGDRDCRFGSIPWSVDVYLKPLDELEYGADLEDLLPYAMEVFGTGPTGGSRTAEPSRRNNRELKRRLGTFYTPSDVAEFIAARTLQNWLGMSSGNERQLPRVLDPACGTGVFLLAAFDQLRSAFSLGDSIVDGVRVCTSSLFGIDVCEQALQGCSFVLLTRIVLRSCDGAPSGMWHHWRAILRNLACLNSVDLLEAYKDESNAQSDQAELFHPGRSDFRMTFSSLNKGFDLILGNPPYSTTRSGIVAVSDGSRGKAYLPFMQMMWRFATENSSASGMVVPLSLGYHTGELFRILREEMSALAADCDIAFFDRTPDSLFGDDVKTRNCIAFVTQRKGSSPSLATTSFIRWNSRRRSAVFTDVRFARADWSMAQKGIPKLGSKLEMECYRRLSGSAQNHVSTYAKSAEFDFRLEPSQLAFGATAYNWLPVFRECPASVSETLRDRGGGLTVLGCSDAGTADLVFALCSSRLAYWLWRVEGDGFHLSRRFLAGLPAPFQALSSEATATLRKLAGRLWSEMLRTPIFSTNKSVRSVSYSPEAGQSTVFEIDSILAVALDLPESFPTFLKGFMRNTIVAGRELEPRLAPSRTRITAGAP